MRLVAVVAVCATGADAKCMHASTKDADPKNNASEAIQKCARNVVWAMKTGITTQPELYANFPDLTVNSSFDDFQCALASKDGRQNETEGWGCDKPCDGGTITFKNNILCAGAATTAAPETTKTPAKGGLPWWGWLLIVLGGLCVIGGLAYAFWPGEKKPKKKKAKRAAAPPAAAPAAAPAPAPVATTSVSMPVYTYAAPPVTTIQAPPVYVEAAPVTYAAPATTVQYAAPASVSYAAPVTTYAAPAAVTYAAPQATVASSVQYGAPVVAGNAFDMIDANHDGVISRGEMQAALS